jgi:RimJ/RimL family protein N-acetyltransferase/anti-anti-sigma regulatory factor
MCAMASQVTPGVVEIAVAADLTHVRAGALAGAIGAQLARHPRALWLNLEDVKVLDVVGLAVIAQAMGRAERARTPCALFPSPVAYRGLFSAGVLNGFPVDRRRAPERGSPDEAIELAGSAPPEFLARTPRLGLRPPSWDDLDMLGRWAQDALLDEMVGSDVLAMCRHLGPHDPDFVSHVIGSPTALTLLIHPPDPAMEPVGFVRLYNVNVEQGFAFLETVIAEPRTRRTAWGIEATRLASAFAVDALGVQRLETKAFAYNVLSINALKRNGFSQEGRLRQARAHDGRRWDILVFAIVMPDIKNALAEDGFPHLGLWPDESP